jgi:hypothetical protein
MQYQDIIFNVIPITFYTPPSTFFKGMNFLVKKALVAVPTSHGLLSLPSQPR